MATAYRGVVRNPIQKQRYVIGDRIVVNWHKERALRSAKPGKSKGVVMGVRVRFAGLDDLERITVDLRLDKKWPDNPVIRAQRDFSLDQNSDKLSKEKK